MKYSTRGFQFKMWRSDNNDINIAITCERGGGGHITVDSTCRRFLADAFEEAALHLSAGMVEDPVDNKLSNQ